MSNYINKHGETTSNFEYLLLVKDDWVGQLGWGRNMNVIDRRNDTFAGGQYIVLRNGYGQQAHTQHSSNTSDRSNARVDGSTPRGLESITGMLDRIGCGYLVLNREKRVIEWNAAAQNTLERQGEADRKSVV